MSELKQLIDYTSLFLARENDHEVIQEHLMNFLKRALSIGCALDETQAVRQNEDAESNFICYHFEKGNVSAKCHKPCGDRGCLAI